MTLQIGVVIPTWNRCAALLECLQHLQAQTVRDFEVIVVDDGSTDETAEALRSYAARAPFRLQYVRQENSGPARARNAGIKRLVAPVCVLIGDDIFPQPDFLEQHLAFHREHPALEEAAVGLTRWLEGRQRVTPFMRWLDRDGVQFQYGYLKAGGQPTWNHFYTSNLSLKTAYLRQNPFHEGFQKAAAEDMELGYRLFKNHGLRLHFLAAAVAEHLHPTTFLNACQRMKVVGASWYQLCTIWPELRMPPPGGGALRRAYRRLLGSRVVLPVLARFADWLQRFWCPNPLLPRVLTLFWRIGWESAARQTQVLNASAMEHVKADGA